MFTAEEPPINAEDFRIWPYECFSGVTVASTWGKLSNGRTEI
jgi:hypothetical protein